MSVEILLIGALVIVVLITSLLVLKSSLEKSNAKSQSLLLEQGLNNITNLENKMNEKLNNITNQMFQGMEKSTERSSSTINKIHERLATLDQAQKNIEGLSTQVQSFKDVLSNKKARGTFGEIQLQDLVSSMLPPSAFVMQALLSNGKRVDCLIKMPSPHGDIAVDSKFPFENYNLYVKAKTDTEKQAYGRAFELDIEKHIKDISAKYLISGETSDTAIMFIPAESIYAEIFSSFNRAVDKAFKAKVLLASPTTLMSTLMTVRAVFKDVKIQQQAKIIQKEIGTLLEDLDRLNSRVSNLDNHFNQAQKDIDQIKTSSSKILSRGDKIQSIEVEDSVDNKKLG